MVIYLFDWDKELKDSEYRIQKDGMCEDSIREDDGPCEHYDSWWGHSLPSLGCLAGSEEQTAPSELRYGPNTLCGSSQESWSMGKRLNQRCRSAKKASSCKAPKDGSRRRCPSGVALWNLGASTRGHTERARHSYL